MTDQQFQKLKQALVNQLDIYRHEIESGDTNWFSIKVLLPHRNNNRSGEPRATLQFEQECDLAATEALK